MVTANCGAGAVVHCRTAPGPMFSVITTTPLSWRNGVAPSASARRPTEAAAAAAAAVVAAAAAKLPAVPQAYSRCPRHSGQFGTRPSARHASAHPAPQCAWRTWLHGIDAASAGATGS